MGFAFGRNLLFTFDHPSLLLVGLSLGVQLSLCRPVDAMCRFGDALRVLFGLKSCCRNDSRPLCIIATR
uniref:Putative secreted protein n=1 Tax=Anopheles triannulatus TaxID=58253 RepID=A0A2M4B6L5_9DIPT